MFDHVTLRVTDLAAAGSAFAALLDELEIEQTTSTTSFSVWGNFALTETDEQHPVARRAHVAFIARSPAHVERFSQAGIAGDFTRTPPGPRPEHADGYHSVLLQDPAGNSFEAVFRDGERPIGNIDHLAIRVSDIEASTAFYATIGVAAGLTIRRQIADLVAFSVGPSDGSLLIVAGEPTQNVHVAFSGDDEDVRRFHEDATAAGYRGNGEPGERPRYHDGYYAAYVLDPDGNNIEVVNHHR
jgi:catechol 2,3-dioxygenase-like lactoylglutathione lyase family enzyme